MGGRCRDDPRFRTRPQDGEDTMTATSEPSSASGATTRPKSDPGREPQPGRSSGLLAGLWRRKTTIIAALAIAGIAAHLALRFGFRTAPGTDQIPLLATLVVGGLPLLYDLLAEAPEAGIRFRSAGRNFHHHVRPARRIPGRIDHRADALRRRSAGELCAPQRLVGAGRAGEAHALGRAPEAGRRTSWTWNCRTSPWATRW